MSAFACPGCGHTLSDPLEVCAQCGWSRYRPSAATMSSAHTGTGVVDAPLTAFPLFPVATHKFIVLTICSFGFYEVYWCYKNWKRINETDREAMSPFWRAFFAPLWGFSLFRRIRDLAAAEGVTTRWSPVVLATLYLVLHMTWRLPDPWWWISMTTVVPMIPVQLTAQQLNQRKAGLVREDPNHRYSGKNIALICIGGLFVLMAVIGTLAPE